MTKLERAAARWRKVAPNQRYWIEGDISTIMNRRRFFASGEEKDQVAEAHEAVEALLYAASRTPRKKG